MLGAMVIRNWQKLEGDAIDAALLRHVGFQRWKEVNRDCVYSCEFWDDEDGTMDSWLRTNLRPHVFDVVSHWGQKAARVILVNEREVTLVKLTYQDIIRETLWEVPKQP